MENKDKISWLEKKQEASLQRMRKLIDSVEDNDLWADLQDALVLLREADYALFQEKERGKQK